MDHTEKHVAYLVRVNYDCCSRGWATVTDFKSAYYHYLKIFDKHDDVEIIKEIVVIRETTSEIKIK